jgi:N-methylhydantoinase A
MQRVIIPASPGVFSAVGLLQAQPEHHVTQSFMSRTAEVSLDALNDAFCRLEKRVALALRTDGYEDGTVTYRRLADLRYVGQAYELTVPVESASLGPDHVRELARRFGDEHERVYGHQARNEPVEFVNLRVVAGAAIKAPSGISGRRQRQAAGERLAYFGHHLIPTAVLTRDDLSMNRQSGPLIVEDYDATTVVPPGCSARLDEWGSIVIDLGAA